MSNLDDDVVDRSEDEADLEATRQYSKRATREAGPSAFAAESDTTESEDPEATIPIDSIQHQPKQADVSQTLDAFAKTLSPEHRDLKGVLPTVTLRPANLRSMTETLSLSVRPRGLRSVEEESIRGDSASGDDPDYLTTKMLGEGGMGTVHLARQVALGRDVALKQIQSRHRNESAVKDEFLTEAVLTGKLEHPNIVPIYEVGSSSDGDLFYSMKNIKGQAWDDSIASLNLDENLDILIDVCDAIAFAHSEGVLHRDLKPQNIMIGGFGEVLVLDWGLAVVVESHGEVEAVAGGTPAYMAPEMINPPFRVGPRSDVYLLGAILFKILTGAAPHAGRSGRDSLESASKNEIFNPDEDRSRKLDSSGELMRVALRALATEPADRFSTVPEFQQAIRDFQSHRESLELSSRAQESLESAESSKDYTLFSRAAFGFEEAFKLWPGNTQADDGVAAARLGWALCAEAQSDFDLALSLLDESESNQEEIRIRVFAARDERDARQHHVRRLRRFSLAASLTVAVVASVAVVWVNSARARALTAQQDEATQRDIAQRNEKEARKQQKVAIIAQEQAEVSAEDARRNLKIAEGNAYTSDMALVQGAWADANMGQVRDLLNRYRNRDDLKGFEWNYWDRLAGSDLLTFRGHTGPVWSVAGSPDGTRLASASSDRTVLVWDAVTGVVLRKFEGHKRTVNCVAFNADGTRIAAGAAGGTVTVWDVDTGEQMATFEGHTTDILGVAFSPNGTRVASASVDFTMRVWDLESGQELLRRFHRGPARCVTFSPDGKWIVSGGGYQDKTIKVFDAGTGQLNATLTEHDGHINSVAFNSDGSKLASGSTDKSVKVWETSSWSETFTLTGHQREVRSVSFSPDGTRVASAAFDSTVKVWDVASGQEMLTLKGHADDVTSVTFGSGGAWLASASLDGTVRIWDAAGQGALALRGHTDPVRCVEFNSDGLRMASASGDKNSQDNTVTVWDTLTWQPILTFEGHDRAVTCTTFSPDDSQLASAGYDRTVKLWDAVRGEETLTLEGHADWIHSVDFSPDGSRLASASSDNTIIVWDTTSGESLLKLEGHTETVLSVAFNSTGTRLASGGIDKTVRIWDAFTGQEVLQLRGHSDRVTAVAFSSDDKRLATTSYDRTVKLWDLVNGQLALDLKGHTRWVNCASFSPDGTRLVTGSGNKYQPGELKLWNATTGQETLTVPGEHVRRISSVAFSPDGLRIATASFDSTARVWDARPWTTDLRTQSQTYQLLTRLSSGAESLSKLQEAIRSTRTIRDAVRTQALVWAEQFWANRRLAPEN